MPKYAYSYLSNERPVYSYNNQDLPQTYYDQPQINPFEPQKVIDQIDRPVGRTGYQRYADVFIGVQNEYQQPVDANYATIYYQENINGSLTPVQSISFPGKSIQIGYQVLIEDTDINNPYFYNINIIGNVVDNDGTYFPPRICDATISTVIIDKKESGNGVKDGQVTIKATSGAGDIQYSIDNLNWQSSPKFSNLAGGAYTAYIKDAGGCTAQLNFAILTVTNLLTADPSVNLGNGNISRWNAAFNPIVFTYQRRDFAVISIQQGNTTAQTVFKINDVLYAGSVVVAEKDWVYINAGPYNDLFQVAAVDLYNNTLTINTPYQSYTGNGFININKLRPYYQVSTKITYIDKLKNKEATITCVHRPNNTGEIKADISSFLQSLLRAKDEATFSQPNYRDTNLSAHYFIEYAQSWQNPATGSDTALEYIKIEAPYYVTYTARQLGDEYGGNMAAYVPFKTVDAPSKRARWITDFSEPAYSYGYPFDIGFIYGDDLAGLNIYAETTPLDINRTPLGPPATTYLLNENGSFLLQQDNSKLVIFRPTITNEPITIDLAQAIGLNRLKLNPSLANEAKFFNIVLKYKDAGNNEHIITQTQTIRIDDAVDEQSVYLRWIGLTGSWNYYRFVMNQEVSLDVQNAVIIKNHILDWAGQDAMEEVISKSAGLKMKVMAEDLSVADIKGLQSIKYSPKAQMLVSKNPAKWQTVVLNTATFAEYETRNGQAPFSVTFNLPGLNIQSQ